MSGTFPSSPGFRAINMRARNFNLSSESVSGRQQVRSLGGHRWAFTVVLPPMRRATFAPIDAFISNQDGMLGTFQIVLPEYSTTSGTASGSAASNGGGSVGDTSMDVDGFTGTLKAGDFVKFASHSKVYMVTADRAGAGSMTFKPALIAAVANDEGITYSSVPFTVRLANDTQEWGVDLDIFKYEIDMIEAI